MFYHLKIKLLKSVCAQPASISIKYFIFCLGDFISNELLDWLPARKFVKQSYLD